jgi:hypothetical protein
MLGNGGGSMSRAMEWGIIAYIPTASLPCDDEAHFDGWYSIRSWADAVFEDFKERYPTALVHLVTKTD